MSATQATSGDDTSIPGVWTGGWSSNSDPRVQNIDLFVVHHAADPRDAATQLDRFMNPNERSVSCSWFMDSDGTAYKVVHPARRQWTTGYTIDQRALTVETRNTSGDPTWGISKASHDGIAALVAWASKTYGFPIDRDHVMGHSEARARFDTSIPATACPGPSMDLNYIVSKAREIAAGGGTTPTKKEDDMRMLADTQRGSLFFNDEFGADHILDYISADINPTEFVQSAQAAFPTTSVNARQWDIANAIANRRWAAKRSQIVNETVAKLVPIIEKGQGVALDPELVKSAIKDALAGAEVGTTLDDATLDAVANRVLDKQHERLAE